MSIYPMEQRGSVSIAITAGSFLSFEIGHINLLSHIFATLGAHPTELDLMRTRFLDFDNIDTR
jgi:hypothetical protein